MDVTQLHTCNGVVFGDYFVSDNIGSLLDETDAIEGFYGFGNKNNLFRRTYIDVDVEVWANAGYGST